MSFFTSAKVKHYQNTISALEAEKSDLIKEKQKLEFDITQLRRNISDLNAKISEQDQTLKSIQPFLDFEKFKIPASFSSLQNRWMIWGVEVHSYPPQILRQERACESILTPLDLDVSHGCGHFRGKEQDYLTTLNSCECVDFKRRLQPCKHMYRLAYELDVYMLEDVAYHPDIHSLLHVADLKRRLSYVPKGQLSVLQDVLNGETVMTENLATCRNLIKNQILQLSDNKLPVLDYFTKDDLHTLVTNTTNAKIPKSITKKKLMDLIISDFPELIKNLEVHAMNVEIHDSIQHLIPYLRRELYRL